MIDKIRKKAITLTFDMNSAEQFNLCHDMAPGENEDEERVKLRVTLVSDIFKYYLDKGRALVAIHLVVDGKSVPTYFGVGVTLQTYALARAWEVKSMRPPKGESMECSPTGATIWGLFTTEDMQEALAAAGREDD